MRAVTITRYAQRLKVHSTPLIQRKENELLIQVHYAPIQPSDQFYWLGRYGDRPNTFPITLGFEGVGTITESPNP